MAPWRFDVTAAGVAHAEWDAAGRGAVRRFGAGPAAHPPDAGQPLRGVFSTRHEGRETAPSEALYRVRLRLMQPPPSERELRGTLRIQGGARSLAWEAVKGTLAALIRESGF